MNILEQIKTHGIDVSLCGGNKIKLSPIEKLTAEIVADVKSHKLEIIKTLKNIRPKCLGVECDFAEYRDKNGVPCLYCGHLEKAVINLVECPQEYWLKDAKGFPKEFLKKKN